ncbi:Acyl-CoA dehydrogenase [Natrarchaeobaculum sulfurireducens]|uniref:Acyl-CoA dehydrogenase n=1 Tax=Natrarchaeobaculum sulfurireducens TaxID=2044521 RepID=A0A346PIL9_9EURY|nr:Acyl-CoA dehydrogenase [Natrarchaeobaculum sulfurireducens]
MLPESGMKGPPSCLTQARIARGMIGSRSMMTDYSPMCHTANLEPGHTDEGAHDSNTLVLDEDLTGITAYE